MNLQKITTYFKFLRMYLNTDNREEVVNAFHKLYYDSYLVGKTWSENKFLGVPIQKCPLDLFVYQEILYETKPDLIIECGTAFGGGALYLASICDMLNSGKVVSIDIAHRDDFPKHDRIEYLTGSSTSPEIISQINTLSKQFGKIMVILDSDHTMSHVLSELELYNSFVTKDCYLIVEDTNVNGHPVRPEHGPGPQEALKQFMSSNRDYVVDKSREGAYMTFNPGGYLKKVV